MLSDRDFNTPALGVYGTDTVQCTVIIIIKHRRACAARVTVFGLCVCTVCLSVCLSVCLLLFSDYRLRGGL